MHCTAGALEAHTHNKDEKPGKIEFFFLLWADRVLLICSSPFTWSSSAAPRAIEKKRSSAKAVKESNAIKSESDERTKNEER